MILIINVQHYIEPYAYLVHEKYMLVKD